MKIKSFFTLLFSATVLSASAQRPEADHVKFKGGELTIQPVNHATLVISYGKTIYVDPVGGADAFKGLAAPDMILITDIHGDHMDPKTLDAVNTNHAILIVPQAVADKLPATTDKTKMVILKNGETTKQLGISITAIPMYNLPESPTAMHTKGRGNGYVLNLGGERVYLSGDTADIPEMRALKNIDIAFVCMNLPYTMDVKTASEGVLAFKPKIVYPYHYRGQDTNQFKAYVNAGDKNIDVRLRDWYMSGK